LKQPVQKTALVGLVSIFKLQAAFVFLEESAEIVSGVEQTNPLLVVESDRKAPEAIDAHSALFTNAEFEPAFLS